MDTRRTADTRGTADTADTRRGHTPDTVDTSPAADTEDTRRPGDTAMALALLLCAHAAATAAAAAPALAWPKDTGTAAACPIAYSQRFSSGGGCDEASATDPTSPHKYCRSVGKQRAVVDAKTSGTNCVSIPWRRYDDPAKHAVHVTDGAGAAVTSTMKNSSATVGEVCFTAAAPGTFAVYFLPFRWAFGGGSGSYCSFFLKPGESVGPNASVALASLTPGRAAATAEFVRFESKTPFDTRSPMEMLASTQEVARMLGSAPRKDYLTFPIAVTNATTQSLRLDALPISLAGKGPSTTVAATGKPGQYVVIQIAVFALDAVENMSVSFSAIGKIPATALTCFQTEGVDAQGMPMPPRTWSLAKGKVGALLIGITVPESGVCEGYDTDALHGGSFVLTPSSGKPTTIAVSMSVACSASRSLALADGGQIDTSDLERLERLKWLNSRSGLESTVTRPYHPLGVSAHDLSCLGRMVSLGDLGLPAKIVANGVSLLAAPMAFEVQVGGSMIAWQTGGSYSVSHDTNGTIATWSTHSTSADGIVMQVEGHMEYDGYVNLAVTLSSKKSVELQDTRLVTNMPKAAVKYASGAGMGDDGGFFPYSNLSALAWRWSTLATPGQAPVIAGGPSTGGHGYRMWAGDVEAGLQIKLKGSDQGWNRPGGDSKSLPGGQKAGANPKPFPTWANGNLGGWNVSTAGGDTALIAFSGNRTLTAGEPLLFNFSLMATPVKGAYLHSETGKREHYKQFRHYHIPYGQWDPNMPTALHADPGATTIILHQSNRLNPYIDWPFAPHVMPPLADYVGKASALGMHVKMYFTIGQITNHMTELFALKSMGGEILGDDPKNLPPTADALTATARGGVGVGTTGMGNGLVANEWLEEHMVSGYQGGWFTLNPGDDEDASIATDTSSRLLNYYVEGQRWLYDKMHLGGLYYDGNSAERSTQQRIRRMTEGLPPTNGTLAVFDVHGRGLNYVEELPYLDSMWTAEGIDFTRGPDYWLISIASIPFGTYGEMLGSDHCAPGPETCMMAKGEGSANKWRGALYGMTNRAGWTGHDPNNNKGMWGLWDEFDIVSASLYGYWNATGPVRVADGHHILATSWVKHGVGAMIAVGSWNPAQINLTATDITIDWAAMGLTAASTALVVPALAGYNDPQAGAKIARADCGTATMKDWVLPVSGNKGWILLLKAATNSSAQA